MSRITRTVQGGPRFAALLRKQTVQKASRWINEAADFLAEVLVLTGGAVLILYGLPILAAAFLGR